MSKEQNIEDKDKALDIDERIALLESESVDAGNVFDGDLWDAEEDIKATSWATQNDVSKDIVLKLWKYFKEESGQPNSAQ